MRRALVFLALCSSYAFPQAQTLSAATAAVSEASPGALEVYFVDVEGGQATLFVTPRPPLAAHRHRLVRQ